MIHSAKFGSIERFLGVLVEHYAGAFPPWLSPVQVLGIPVADEYNDYLESVLDRILKIGASNSTTTQIVFQTPHEHRPLTRAMWNAASAMSRD